MYKISNFIPSIRKMGALLSYVGNSNSCHQYLNAAKDSFAFESSWIFNWARIFLVTGILASFIMGTLAPFKLNDFKNSYERMHPTAFTVLGCRFLTAGKKLENTCLDDGEKIVSKLGHSLKKVQNPNFYFVLLG